MATVTVDNFLEQLGDIPRGRILSNPPPGMATEADVLEVERRTGLAPELIDGVLVEKAVGYLESRLAVRLIRALDEFVSSHKLGIVLAGDGPLRILPGQIRLPDACFVSREQFSDGELPDVPILGLAPDLAVEVLSRGNTRAEMLRKLHDYFNAGVRLVWYIDPREKSIRVYMSPEDCATLGENDLLDGGDVLPGFTMPVGELFAALTLD